MVSLALLILCRGFDLKERGRERKVLPIIIETGGKLPRPAVMAAKGPARQESGSQEILQLLGSADAPFVRMSGALQHQICF